ncbi:hypothetical protein BDR06DRAFT_890039, partial [Suillus hirtellus]
ELWGGMPEAQVSNYNAFMKEVKVMYPGWDGKRRYALSDLQAIAHKYTNKTMPLYQELSNYLHAFKKIMQPLLAEDRIGTVTKHEYRRDAPTFNNCAFCGSLEHYYPHCAEKQRYIDAGKCKVSEETHKLVLPNGNWIPGQGLLKEHLDQHHASCKGKEVVKEAPLSAPISAKAPLKGTSPSSSTPASSTPVSSSSSSPSQSSALPPLSSSTPTQAPAQSSSYCYAFALEDKEADKRVVECLLNSNLNIPVRELLAVSPDVRQHFHELTTKKCVTVGAVSVHELSGHPVTDQWLKQYEDVRMRSDDRRTLTCILDQGAEVVVMPREVWKELSIPLRLDHSLNMESVNTSRNATLGVIENVPLDFGAGPLYFQVQVIECVTFEVLLGHPFFKLTSCRTFDLPDREQDFILTDPNARKELHIPTLPWVK